MKNLLAIMLVLILASVSTASAEEHGMMNDKGKDNGAMMNDNNKTSTTSAPTQDNIPNSTDTTPVYNTGTTSKIINAQDHNSTRSNRTTKTNPGYNTGISSTTIDKNIEIQTTPKKPIINPEFDENNIMRNKMENKMNERKKELKNKKENIKNNFNGKKEEMKNGREDMKNKLRNERENRKKEGYKEYWYPQWSNRKNEIKRNKDEMRNNREEMRNNREEMRNNREEMKNEFKKLDENTKTELKDTYKKYRDEMNSLKKEYKDSLNDEGKRDDIKNKMETLRQDSYNNVKTIVGNNPTILKKIKQKESIFKKNLKLRKNDNIARKALRGDRSKFISKYKKSFNLRLKNVIDRIPDSKLQIVAKKIDAAIVKIENNSRLSDLKKNNIMDQVLALKEIIDERIAASSATSDVIDINSLLTF